MDVELQVKLTPEEIKERGQQLASVTREKLAVLNAKADAMKAYREQLQEFEDEQMRLARIIQWGEEKRHVSCMVNFHTPNVGMKTIYRADTGELVREESMAPEECQEQLFHEEVDVPKPKPVN